MERCSSSTSYMDYHRHSMAGNNFCYPYSPGMMRNGGSPYPMGGVGSAAPRYGMADYRSGGYYGEGGFDKYYGGGGGGYHAGYGANYYGNGYASYRDFGYNDYYQGSAFAGHHGAGGYHGPAGSSSHLYGGRQSLPLAFQRESYYHHQRDHPHGSPYGFGGNYSGNPYKAESSSTTPNSTNSGDAALFGGAPNGNSFQHSPDYPYGSSGDSPGGPEGSGSRGSGGAPGYPTSPSSSAMPNATAPVVEVAAAPAAAPTRSGVTGPEVAGRSRGPPTEDIG
ncbi:hypothetical protein pipiens_004074 [Culex pipiens pipiens]|uniref:Uncharacterized protein n=1 Tax=Culex pipiens pipiens TaxID=38569 RepID=A0ABD1CNK1_CULPP